MVDRAVLKTGPRFIHAHKITHNVCLKWLIQENKNQKKFIPIKLVRFQLFKPQTNKQRENHFKLINKASYGLPSTYHQKDFGNNLQLFFEIQSVHISPHHNCPVLLLSGKTTIKMLKLTKVFFFFSLKKMNTTRHCLQEKVFGYIKCHELKKHHQTS